jgi:hypothetical protein
MQKVFSLLFNNHPDYRKCVESRIIPDWVDHELITQRVLTEGKRPFTEDTDIERLYHMQKNPNAWYLDADVEIIKWPDFEMEPGYPYISYHEPSRWHDNWCILGNGCQSFFDDLMQRYEKFNGDPPVWWSHELFNGELKDKIKKLPEGYFKHLYYGRDKIANPI